MSEQMRPPYVRFQRQAVEDRTQQTESGAYGFKDVDIALITVPGQKDTVTKYVPDWLADLEKSAKDGRVPIEWPARFREAYEYWRTGQEIPVNGTPIRGWQLLTPAQQEVTIAGGVTTVEDLAQASDEALRRLGIGALAFKQKAQAWIKEGQSVGKVAEENATLKRDVESLRLLVERQSEQLAEQSRLLKDLTAPAKVDTF